MSDTDWVAQCFLTLLSSEWSGRHYFLSDQSIWNCRLVATYMNRLEIHRLWF